MRLTIEAVSRIRSQDVWLGCDRAGALWVYLSSGRQQPLVGDVVDTGVGEHRCVGESPPAEVVRVLEKWCAWRLVRKANPEIGMGVLIMGAGQLAEDVIDGCQRHGSAWHARWDAASSNSTEGSQLARSPDAVFILHEPVRAIPIALGICRDGGTVLLAADAGRRAALDLYSDAHRRGLRIVAQSDDAVWRSIVEMWDDEWELVKSSFLS